MSQAEATGRLRLLRAVVASRAELTHKILDARTLDRDVESLVRRGSERGRQRAAVRLRAFLPAVFEWRRVTSGLLGAYLEAARYPIIQTPSDPGQTQPSVAVAYLVLGTEEMLTATGLWTLEVPDHALRRALERDRPGDVEGKIREAHAALLRASIDRRPPIGGEFLIPTSGPGVFVAEWIPGKLRSNGKHMVYARARTWLHDDQLSSSQARQVLSSAASGEASLYDAGLLTPVVLRKQL
jgi:hypothetical protein